MPELHRLRIKRVQHNRTVNCRICDVVKVVGRQQVHNQLALFNAPHAAIVSRVFGLDQQPAPIPVRVPGALVFHIEGYMLLYKFFEGRHLKPAIQNSQSFRGELALDCPQGLDFLKREIENPPISFIVEGTFFLCELRAAGHISLSTQVRVMRNQQIVVSRDLYVQLHVVNA